MTGRTDDAAGAAAAGAAAAGVAPGPALEADTGDAAVATAELAAALLAADDPAAGGAGPASAGGRGAGPTPGLLPDDLLPDDLLPGGGRPLPLGATLRSGGLALVLVLSLLNLLDNAERAALTVLAPDIQRALHLSDAALGGVVGLGAVLLTAGGVPLGLLADRRRRTTLAAVCAAVAAGFAALTGAVGSAAQLVGVRIGAGLGQAAVLPVHNSLLADGYPVGGRASVYAVHNVAGPLGLVVAPVLAGGVAEIAGWRWAFVTIAAILLLVALATLTLREPPRGRGERDAVLAEAEAEAGVQDDTDTRTDTRADTSTDTDTDAAAARARPVPVEVGIARLLKIRALRSLMLGVGALGFALVGVPTFVNRLLDEQYGLSALQRGLVGAVVQAGMVVGVVAGAVLGDRRFRRDPPSAIALAGTALAVHGLVLTAALAMRPLPLLVALMALAAIPLGVVVVPLFSFVAAVVPYQLRALGFAMVGVSVTLLGGFLGGLLVGDVSGRHGPRTALIVFVPVATLLAAAFVVHGARFVRSDLALVVEELQEERDERARLAGGGRLPLLSVRNLDVSYGAVQVLFGVDLDVWPGETLALLGTNGAGKSTLLRAVTGLEIPDRGVVRLAGRTITLDAAEQRVRDGIVLVPGGRGLFPTLTAAENLLAGAHTVLPDRTEVEARAEQVLELFPRLRERLHQPAGTLSGGEQQMLALAKALLLRPRLLLVDELSLGLAPAAVAELLDVLRRLRADGTTIVLVEQSVNVALAVADRAVFLEKGEVRFTGPADGLLERGDLVRAVFLGQA